MAGQVLGGGKCSIMGRSVPSGEVVGVCFTASVAQVLSQREQVMEDVLMGRCWHIWVQATGDTSLFFPVPHRL